MKIPDNVFHDAVHGFWDKRLTQRQTQALSGRIDQSNRSDVTGGKQMDGFALVLTDLLVAGGRPPAPHPITEKHTVLPGYFRPTKTYDFLVVLGGRFPAAVELKSQVGPSFGNNFNNRAEEAMGSAFDIWTAYREGAFGSAPPPWLGCLLVLEDCQASRTPIKLSEPHFSVFQEFKSSYYATRYELFCRKMVRERHDNAARLAACLLTADRQQAGEQINYAEPADDLSAENFLAGLMRHVAPV